MLKTKSFLPPSEYFSLAENADSEEISKPVTVILFVSRISEHKGDLNRLLRSREQSKGNELEREKKGILPTFDSVSVCRQTKES